MSERMGARIRAAADEVRAPDSLRRQIERDARHVPHAGRRWRTLAIGAGTAALAAGLAVGALRGEPAPTARQAAALALRAPDLPPPRTDARDPRYLRAAVGGVRFPDYRHGTPWRAAGSRRDAVGGRDAQTVTYALRGERIGYTIVDGEPLAVPARARRLTRDGVRMASWRHGGALVVAWRQGGRTCVLASRTAGLERLAAWAAWT